MDTSSIANLTGTSTSTSTSTKKSANLDTGLSVTDFLSLISAQLQNQDMMNPMKDTEFMSQLAQFTALQATQNLVDLNTTSYATSLLGKEITAAATNSNGELKSTTGVVTGVSFFNGSPMVYIGDAEFEMSQIMVAGKLPTVKTAETTTTPDASTTTP